MHRRLYLLLILVRLYFALQPSYLHPDENFQGPEVIAGSVFSYPVHLTWEFTSAHPVRSIFPLWPVYGLPMLLLRSVWPGTGQEEVAPSVVFWTLRVLMFILSFVLEDWAIHELVPSPRRRRAAILLVASSYVTWTFQTHTFSNSIETLLVAWCLVVIQRIVDDKHRSSIFASSLLGVLIPLGVFNRITFPAYLLIPGLRLLPHFMRQPFSLFAILFFGIATTGLAIITDTVYYTESAVTLSTLFRNPVITPWNNLRYNFDPSNLAEHGLHPYYQHVLANLPQLLGPAFLLLLSPIPTLRLASAVSGILVLSLFQHQEARFLLPAIPLILSSVQLPRRYPRAWITSWIAFNAFLGILMGTYHQGGIVPTQLFLANQPDATNALWWKTYSPPLWLLNGKNFELTTRDMMGAAPEALAAELSKLTPCDCDSVFANQNSSSRSSPAYVSNGHLHSDSAGTYLIAPFSATFLDQYSLSNTLSPQSALPPSSSSASSSPSSSSDPVEITVRFLNTNGYYSAQPPTLSSSDDKDTDSSSSSSSSPQADHFRLTRVWLYRNHLNLDDLDFASDGIWPTLRRVVGRRGLAAWRVTRECHPI
ncbi:glycosyltransferase family 22 protein [Xylona heveae TC161]|uniref:Mannosyltransferase n=1 Tax=Xylona heveae (strain CBS 132557 / TC161) TaxID=1328760 RepID=A0A165GTT7_XYLHT|nr:glycosyltransferase family 22 protein [Xylona heveae TC161]KZF22590.1 glycosyltransferase family 22 protein [Xylona heveae TC161]